MRIAFISETFSKQMGYLQNTLPKYLARHGAEVHLITAGVPPYFDSSDFRDAYSGFSALENLQPDTVEQYEGYTLHVLRSRKVFGYRRIIGLGRKLRSIRPDVVQSHPAIGWIPFDAALHKLLLGYKLFTGQHNASSGFPLATQKLLPWSLPMLRCYVTRWLPGRFTSWLTEKCYAVTLDCGQIAWRYYGVQKRKVVVMYLPVDTDYMYPVRSDESSRERQEVRRRLGVAADEILCIYTGKLNEVKNALLLAQAIERLRAAGQPYRGLFIGAGTQQQTIRECPSALVLDFVPYCELAPYYRASDIGVWTGNESISQLDAAACGLPLIVSDLMGYFDHVKGNGLVFHYNDLEDLMRVLLRLRDSGLRQQWGACAASKMMEHFSASSVAQRRLLGYSGREVPIVASGEGEVSTDASASAGSCHARGH